MEYQVVPVAQIWSEVPDVVGDEIRSRCSSDEFDGIETPAVLAAVKAA